MVKSPKQIGQQSSTGGPSFPSILSPFPSPETSTTGLLAFSSISLSPDSLVKIRHLFSFSFHLIKSFYMQTLPVVGRRDSVASKKKIGIGAVLNLSNGYGCGPGYYHLDFVVLPRWNGHTRALHDIWYDIDSPVPIYYPTAFFFFFSILENKFKFCLNIKLRSKSWNIQPIKTTPLWCNLNLWVVKFVSK